MTQRILAVLLLIGVFNAPVFAQDVQFRHDGYWRDASYQRAGGVTDIAWSRNGRYIAVAYYRGGMNRIRSDWAVHTARWDLETGQRVIVPDTCAPLCFIGDHLITGVPERRGGWELNNGRGTHRYLFYPVSGLRIGDPMADDGRSFAAPQAVEDSIITVIPWDRGCMAADLSGRLWQFSLRGLKDDEPIERSGPIVSIELDAVPTGPPWRVLTLCDRSSNGALAALLGEAAESDIAIYEWWRPLRPGDPWTLKRTLPALTKVEPEMARHWLFLSRGCNAAFKLTSANQLIKTSSEHYRGEPRSAITAQRSTTAWQDRGVVRVQSGLNPEMVIPMWSRYPELALNRDGTLLATASPRGVVYLWSVETGRVVRVLRLDDVTQPTVRVAAIQCASELGDVKANRKKLLDHVGNAAHAGARIVVLPEAALTGYLSADLEQTWQVDDRSTSDNLRGVDPAETALSLDDPRLRDFADMAATYGLYLTVPFVEVDRKTEEYFNTTVVYGPTGERVIHYRKHNPWPWAEQSWATKGDLGHPVVDTPWGRLGALICFDIHDQAAAVAAKNIDILLYSIAWVEDRGSDWFDTQLPAIAAEHDCNIIAANWTVNRRTPPPWRGYGQSRIIGRDGQVMASCKDDLVGEIIYADVPLPATAD